MSRKQFKMENENEIICALNTLGFSKSSAEKRAEIYRNMSAVTTLSRRRKYPSELQNVDIVYVGSRSEGVAIYFDTDMDILYINRTVVCCGELGNLNADLKNRFSTVFELDLTSAPAGYSQLKLIYPDIKSLGQNTFQTILKNCLVNIEGNMFLRSDSMLDVAKQFLHRATSENLKKDETRGPAETYESESSRFSYPVFDLVLALPCSGTSFLQEWSLRTRESAWPSQEVIDKVEKSEVLVVPVGHKTEKDAYLQWRISFTQGETILVRSLNDMELKMYTVLKMIAKQRLVPVCENLDSYVMKNVTFWCVEQLRMRETEQVSLTDRIKLALDYLKDHIEEGFLPNYFVPSRNLLEGRVTLEQTSALIALLNQLISKDAEVFRSLKSICDVLSLDDEIIRMKIYYKEVMEEVRLAGFALPPDEAVAVFEEAEKFSEIQQHFEILTKRVFPFIRENNPFGFFEHIRSMTDAELIRFFERI